MNFWLVLLGLVYLSMAGGIPLLIINSPRSGPIWRVFAWSVVALAAFTGVLLVLLGFNTFN